MSCLSGRPLGPFRVVAVFGLAGPLSASQEAGWGPLFDGQSLSGWHIVPGGQWQGRDVQGY
jgi:hypothetical protein